MNLEEFNKIAEKIGNGGKCVVSIFMDGTFTGCETSILKLNDIDEGGSKWIVWTEDFHYGVGINEARVKEVISFEPFKKSFSKDGLSVGDIIVDKDGDEAKILEVFENTFIKTNWTKTESFADAYIFNFKKAKEYGWIIKQDESVKEVEEMTLEEVCKELGRNIKLIKK